MNHHNYLNIAMLGHKHMLTREGGIEIVVKELATRMSKRGHHVVCYDRRIRPVNGEAMPGIRNYKGVKIVSVFTIDKKGFAAVISSFVASWRAGNSKADLVHIHGEGPALMCWIPKLRRKRIIVTIHGLDWRRAKWNRIGIWLIKLGEKTAVKSADEIIVLSRNAQDYFQRKYGRETIFIPNGVEEPEYRDADQITKNWGLKKDSYVLYVGRIVPEKGIKCLIDAWKGMQTDKKLVIAGGSSDTENYLSELRRLSPENVIFTGFQRGEILRELYSNAYLYCIPSDIEGMPLSLLEAMSYGNCCVVSDIPECTEVAEDKAVIFPKGNVLELRRTLQNLVDEPQIVEEKRAGVSDFILSKYKWDEVINKTLELYSKVYET